MTYRFNTHTGSKERKMTKVTSPTSQDNNALTLAALSFLTHCNVWIKYQKHVLFSLLKQDLFLWLSNHWPLKMINSIFAKVENYAWFWEPFQTIRFRRGQQVRVSWRFGRPATDTPHCVLIGVVDSHLRWETKPLCERVLLCPQNSASPLRKFNNCMLHILF